MTNLAKKAPLGQKTGGAPKRKKRRPLPRYIAAMHKLSCVACIEEGLIQISPTQAHHCICGRFSSKRAGDEDAIPLCMGHHQGGHIPGDLRISIHRDKAAWQERFGPDTRFIAETRKRLARHLPEDLRP